MPSIGKHAFPTSRSCNGSSQSMKISQDPQKLPRRVWVLNICYLSTQIHIVMEFVSQKYDFSPTVNMRGEKFS